MGVLLARTEIPVNLILQRVWGVGSNRKIVPQEGMVLSVMCACLDCSPQGLSHRLRCCQSIKFYEIHKAL